MDTPKNCYLVPFDFTQVAENAVQHAVLYSKKTAGDIVLVNIVKKETQINELEIELKSAVEKLQDKYDVKIHYIIREGSIFKTINQVGEELEAQLIIMGTHGMKGMQKLTGSWALKVIVGSRIPYVVIQNPPIQKEVPNIVFPVDFKTENKEKLRWAEFMAQRYNAKVYIFSSTTKEGVVEARTKANLVFCKKFMDEKGIDYELSLAEGSSSFAQETVSFSEKVEADLIIIMTTRDIAFHDYVLGAHEQHIIANNSGIPVLVVNPRTDLMKFGYGFL